MPYVNPSRNQALGCHKAKLCSLPSSPSSVVLFHFPARKTLASQVPLHQNFTDRLVCSASCSAFLSIGFNLSLVIKIKKLVNLNKLIYTIKALWFEWMPCSVSFRRVGFFLFTQQWTRNISYERIFMLRNISVPSPLSQERNTTLFCYIPPVSFPSVKDILNKHDIQEDQLSPLSRATMRVCFLYYCRIRELLNATIGDVVSPDRVVLHGLKHSNSYVIYLPGLSAQILRSDCTDKSIVLFPISYMKLYRDAVRVGAYLFHDGGKNKKRLHAARYAFCAAASLLVMDSEFPALLRHKSSKSYLSYTSK